MTWQPIKTAPKDGTSVLVYDYYLTDWEKQDDGRYKQTGDSGYGWVVARCDCTYGWVIHQRRWNIIKCVNPTHWMPLPEPPEI